MVKAAQIIENQPIDPIETKIDLTKPDQTVQDVVQVIRNQYPPFNDGIVISATEKDLSKTETEYKVDILLPETDNVYKVDEVKVKVNTATPD